MFDSCMIQIRCLLFIEKYIIQKLRENNMVGWDYMEKQYSIRYIKTQNIIQDLKIMKIVSFAFHGSNHFSKLGCKFYILELFSNQNQPDYFWLIINYMPTEKLINIKFWPRFECKFTMTRLFRIILPGVSLMFFFFLIIIYEFRTSTDLHSLCVQ